MNEELKCCPFCGEKAVIKWEKEGMRSVGCGAISMLCPTPSLVIYADESGKFDYQFWNRRF